MTRKACLAPGRLPRAASILPKRTAILLRRQPAWDRRKVTNVPEWLLGLIQSGLTVVALIVIMLALAALFMIIFGIATSIDERIQE